MVRVKVTDGSERGSLHRKGVKGHYEGRIAQLHANHAMQVAVYQVEQERLEELIRRHKRTIRQLESDLGQKTRDLDHFFRDLSQQDEMLAAQFREITRLKAALARTRPSPRPSPRPSSRSSPRSSPRPSSRPSSRSAPRTPLPAPPPILPPLKRDEDKKRQRKFELALKKLALGKGSINYANDFKRRRKPVSYADYDVGSDSESY